MDLVSKKKKKDIYLLFVNVVRNLGGILCIYFLSDERTGQRYCMYTSTPSIHRIHHSRKRHQGRPHCIIEKKTLHWRITRCRPRGHTVISPQDHLIPSLLPCPSTHHPAIPRHINPSSASSAYPPYLPTRHPPHPYPRPYSGPQDSSQRRTRP
jgi:hypothetical protein